MPEMEHPRRRGDYIIPKMKYPELEELIEVLKHALKYGHLSEAAGALRIISRHVGRLVEEEKGWRERETKIIEERKRNEGTNKNV